MAAVQIIKEEKDDVLPDDNGQFRAKSDPAEIHKDAAIPVVTGKRFAGGGVHDSITNAILNSKWHIRPSSSRSQESLGPCCMACFRISSLFYISR